MTKINPGKIAAKAIIFDLDGTLLDSMPSWDNIGVDYVKSKGVEPPADLKKTLSTMSYSEAARHFINVLGIDIPDTQVFSEINNMMEHNYQYHLAPKPYVREFLEWTGNKNLKTCVVTTTDRVLAELALKRLGLLERFQFILTCEEAGKSKRYPDIYQQAAARLGYDPQDIAVFEDALYCIKTAKKAGFFVVAVADDHALKDLSDIISYADVYLDSYRDAQSFIFI